MPAFILQFQEPCEPPAADVRAGTQTITRQATEESDADRDGRGGLLPGGAVLGTKTMTFVNNEGMDDDPGGGSGATLLPRSAGPICGTMTKTETSREAVDRDPGESSYTAIPACC